MSKLIKTQIEQFVQSIWCAYLCLLLLCLSCADAMGKNKNEADYIAIAEVFIADGLYERAENALKQVDLEQKELDLGRYHRAQGLLAYNKNQLDIAIKEFILAQKAGAVDQQINLFLAQAYFNQQQYKEAIRAIDAAGAGAENIAATYLMRAHAQWMLGEQESALNALSVAASKFPGNQQFVRRQVFYLIELGLGQTAVTQAKSLLDDNASAEDYLAIGSALRRAKQWDQALQMLERANLQFPQHDNIAKALSQTYLERGQKLAAANLFSNVALRNPNLMSEAAELYRRAKHPMLALSFNTRVQDSEKKLKQRVGILADLKRYEQIIGMESALVRANLLQDQDVRYALAYALFRGGEFERAKTHLGSLSRADLFRKSAELRKLMEECANARWNCG